MSRMGYLQWVIKGMTKIPPKKCIYFTTDLLGWNDFTPMKIKICSHQQFCNDILYFIGESWQYKILKRKCVWSFSLKSLRVAQPQQRALSHRFSDKVKSYLQLIHIFGHRCWAPSHLKKGWWTNPELEMHVRIFYGPYANGQSVRQMPALGPRGFRFGWTTLSDCSHGSVRPYKHLESTMTDKEKSVWGTVWGRVLQQCSHGNCL